MAQNRERFLTVLSDMTGHHVKVALVDGTTFKAIFHTVKDFKKNKIKIIIIIIIITAEAALSPASSKKQAAAPHHQQASKQQQVYSKHTASMHAHTHETPS